MTENEAIKNVTAYVYMECENMPMQVVKALDVMKNCTKEIQQYRAIGTVEEFKALKEKQEKGLLLELPCKIGDWVWTWEYPTRIDEEDGSTWTICDIKRATIVSKRFNIFMLDRVGESYFVSKEEAEQALAKKQGK